MSRFGIAFDPRFKRHLTGPGHAERPERLDAVAAALEWNGLLQRAARIEATPIDLSIVRRLHAPEYVERLRRACAENAPYIDAPDSAICPESFEIGRLAAGAVVEAARRIAVGEIDRAFCAVRPPGHHAEEDRSMGFCLFNNVALAAQVLRFDHGFERVLILDWDVHHGNGTQHLFDADPTVFFISLHGHPDVLYPGTGYADEVGVGPGHGFTLNIPFRPGARDADYQQAFREAVIPAIEGFRPEIILLSCGFDAHHADPLGCISLTEDGFHWMLGELLTLAQRYCEGRLLSVLEGGYDLEALRRCTAEHVAQLSDGK